MKIEGVNALVNKMCGNSNTIECGPIKMVGIKLIQQLREDVKSKQPTISDGEIYARASKVQP